MNSTKLDLHLNNVLRGFAIIAVLTLHTISATRFSFHTDLPHWQVVVILDQFCRFCVPLFVALSGYSFWQKYQKQEMQWTRFLWSQSKKLLPWYILASAVFYLVFTFIPAWQSPGVTRSFIGQLWSGKADYHLYFVPMIFQLYLLFPVLYLVMKKLHQWSWVMVVIAGVFQVYLYLLYSSSTPSPFIAHNLFTDQQQYPWFFSWIFYFVLGMQLPRVVSWVEEHQSMMLGIAGGTLFSFIWICLAAVLQLQHGVDPIIALRFTRVPVLAYATMMIVLLITGGNILIHQPDGQKLSKQTWMLYWLGKFSYVLYLFHTLALRFIFAFPF